MKNMASELNTNMILTKKVFLLLFFCFLIIPFLFLAVRGVYAQQQNARIYLEPQPLSLAALDATGTMEIRLDNVASTVGGFQLEIAYDPSIVHANRITLDPLGSFVRSYMTLGPIINNNNGEVSVGAINIPSQENIIPDTRPVVLAEIEWKAVVNNGTTTLSFDERWTSLMSSVPPHNEIPLEPFENGSVQVGTAAPTATPTPTLTPTTPPTPTLTPTPTVTPSSTPTPTPTATPTVTPTPVLCGPPGDIDCSGRVNSLDFSYLIAHYNTSDPQADLDDSGRVDALDLVRLLANFGKSR